MERPSTLKNHCELKTCLTDKPDTVLKSPDNSEQNQWEWLFDFFFFNFFFLHRALNNEKEVSITDKIEIKYEAKKSRP